MSALYPPPQFDHPHPQGQIIHWLSESEMQKICHTYTACTFMLYRHSVCHIYINLRWRGTWVEPLYVRHERAHCNGWRHQ